MGNFVLYIVNSTFQQEICKQVFDILWFVIYKGLNLILYWEFFYFPFLCVRVTKQVWANRVDPDQTLLAYPTRFSTIFTSLEK